MNIEFGKAYFKFGFSKGQFSPKHSRACNVIFSNFGYSNKKHAYRFL